MKRTCKDCLHFEACKYMYEAAFDQQWFPFGTCDRFKYNSHFVEFPCAIGDTIFRVAEFLCKTEPVEYRVSGLSVKKDKTIKIKLSDNIGVFEITKSDIGKSCFLTYEDAKTELDRRMNDGKM